MSNFLFRQFALELLVAARIAIDWNAREKEWNRRSARHTHTHHVVHVKFIEREKKKREIIDIDRKNVVTIAELVLAPQRATSTTVTMPSALYRWSHTNMLVSYSLNMWSIKISNNLCFYIVWECVVTCSNFGLFRKVASIFHSFKWQCVCAFIEKEPTENKNNTPLIVTRAIRVLSLCILQHC